MKRNWTHITATLIVLAFALGSLAISFSHVIELAHRYGVEGWQAWTAPFLVDGFMLLGRLGMSRRFDTATNRIGRRMLVAGALLSLAANVGVGVTVGQRVYGALVVIGFLVSEWYAGKLAPAPVVTVETAEETAARELAEKRSAAAKQAAVTRAANRAKKAAAAKPARSRTARTTALAAA